jgi:hypothetical protein
VETLAWENLAPYLNGSIPCILSMGGTRGVKIGYDPHNKNIFLRIPTDPEIIVPPSPYVELETSLVRDETGYVLEILTSSIKLFKEFHRFSGIITEDFEYHGQSAIGAFNTAIKRWNELLIKRELLTEEQQIGLQGELIFLGAILQKEGPKAITSWTGRNESKPERHDFRIKNAEIEIKTTKSLRRIHYIHGLNQLQPSEGYLLFLLSFKFESAGYENGTSLFDEVEKIKKILKESDNEIIEFEQKLKSSGYYEVDSPYYQRKFIFSDPPIFIEVNDKFPKITKNILSDFIPNDLLNRIDNVTYCVDVEGLNEKNEYSDFFENISSIMMKDQLNGKSN